MIRVGSRIEITSSTRTLNQGCICVVEGANMGISGQRLLLLQLDLQVWRNRAHMELYEDWREAGTRPEDLYDPAFFQCAGADLEGLTWKVLS